ncbi:hypothetical protein ARMSODRAFT_436818 [Armillaria solidipes]|uniref:Uncharacterized protein n=1 Tax=Armillaria solidipes TaxID=1076256 RepID=A0A2H3B748_9AGAR|nr:hypothetical protein ARMSODRAFT_436818 [Armillaria solidipes]
MLYHSVFPCYGLVLVCPVGGPCMYFASLTMARIRRWCDFVIAHRFPSYASNDAHILLLLPTLHCPAKWLYPARSTQSCDQDGMATAHGLLCPCQGCGAGRS